MRLHMCVFVFMGFVPVVKIILQLMFSLFTISCSETHTLPPNKEKGCNADSVEDKTVRGFVCLTLGRGRDAAMLVFHRHSRWTTLAGSRLEFIRCKKKIEVTASGPHDIC